MFEINKLRRCHIDTICLAVVFAVGTYIVHRKLQEDYKTFNKNYAYLKR